ncbi:transcriptional regulator, partial [Klebsiella pneumoniae]
YKRQEEVKETKSKKSKCAGQAGQNDTMAEGNVKRSTRAKRISVIRSNGNDDLTENTTESTTEITGKDSCPVALQPDQTKPADLVL